MALILDDFGHLPAGDPHPASLEEVREVFVRQAPFPDLREKIYGYLELFTREVWEVCPQAYFWVNGGFITHKTWPPKDVDIATFVPVEDVGLFFGPERLSLHTLQSVSVQSPRVTSDRVQPFGGYIDSFILPDTEPFREQWHSNWGKVKAKTGELLEGRTKGFVEVRNYGN